jgi:hypothetical protein
MPLNLPIQRKATREATTPDSTPPTRFYVTKFEALALIYVAFRLPVAGALFAIDHGNATEVAINALRDRATRLPKKDGSQSGIRARLDAIDRMRKETAVKREAKERPVRASRHRHRPPPGSVAS